MSFQRTQGINKSIKAAASAVASADATAKSAPTLLLPGGQQRIRMAVHFGIDTSGSNSSWYGPIIDMCHSIRPRSDIAKTHVISCGDFRSRAFVKIRDFNELFHNATHPQNFLNLFNRMSAPTVVVIESDGELDYPREFFSEMNKMAASGQLEFLRGLYILYSPHTSEYTITRVNEQFKTVLKGTPNAVEFRYTTFPRSGEGFSRGIIRTLAAAHEPRPAWPEGYLSAYDLFAFRRGTTSSALAAELRGRPALILPLLETLQAQLEERPNAAIDNEATSTLNRTMIMLSKKFVLGFLELQSPDLNQCAQLADYLNWFNRLAQKYPQLKALRYKAMEDDCNEAFGAIEKSVCRWFNFECTHDEARKAAADGSGYLMRQLVQHIAATGRFSESPPADAGVFGRAAIPLLKTAAMTPENCRHAFAVMLPGVALGGTQLVAALLMLLGADAQVPRMVLDMLRSALDSPEVIRSAIGFPDLKPNFASPLMALAVVNACAVVPGLLGTDSAEAEQLGTTLHDLAFVQKVRAVVDGLLESKISISRDVTGPVPRVQCGDYVRVQCGDSVHTGHVTTITDDGASFRLDYRNVYDVRDVIIRPFKSGSIVVFGAFTEYNQSKNIAAGRAPKDPFPNLPSVGVIMHVWDDANGTPVADIAYLDHPWPAWKENKEIPLRGADRGDSVIMPLSELEQLTKQKNIVLGKRVNRFLAGLKNPADEWRREFGGWWDAEMSSQFNLAQLSRAEVVPNLRNKVFAKLRQILDEAPVPQITTTLNLPVPPELLLGVAAQFVRIPSTLADVALRRESMKVMEITARAIEDIAQQKYVQPWTDSPQFSVHGRDFVLTAAEVAKIRDRTMSVLAEMNGATAGNCVGELRRFVCPCCFETCRITDEAKGAPMCGHHVCATCWDVLAPPLVPGMKIEARHWCCMFCRRYAELTPPTLLAALDTKNTGGPDFRRYPDGEVLWTCANIGCDRVVRVPAECGDNLGQPAIFCDPHQPLTTAAKECPGCGVSVQKTAGCDTIEHQCSRDTTTRWCWGCCVVLAPGQHPVQCMPGIGIHGETVEGTQVRLDSGDEDDEDGYWY